MNSIPQKIRNTAAVMLAALLVFGASQMKTYAQEEPDPANPTTSEVTETTEGSDSGEESVEEESSGTAYFEESITESGENTLSSPEEFFNADSSSEDSENSDSSDDSSEDEDTSNASEETVTENAIQLAISKALESADEDTVELTVTIEEGTYDGDITIHSSDTNVSDPSKFTLYVLAKDSYSEPESGSTIDKSLINADASGNTKFNGSISIDGINVVMAGLYFSMQQSVKVKNSFTKIYGTTENDNVNLELGDGAKVEVLTGDGADEIYVSGSDDANDSHKTADLDGGSGQDVYRIDLSAGSSGDESSNVKIIDSGNDGTLTLTGELKESASVYSDTTGTTTEGGDEVISINADTSKASLGMKDSSDRKVNILTSGIKTFADELTNKKTIKIQDTDLVNRTYQLSSESVLTDYVFAGDYGALKEQGLILEGSGYFTNFIIEKDEFTVGDIQADNINVILRGKKITAEGTITAANVTVEASDSDQGLEIELPSAVSNLSEDGTISAGAMDFTSTAEIKLSETSSITSTGSVVLKATSIMNKALLPFAEGINIINVKISRAVITIAGVIKSALNFIARAFSSITAEADSPTKKLNYIPFAVGVGVNEAGTYVTETASVEAGDVDLSSSAVLNITTTATIGQLPLSIAVSAGTNDSHVNIAGSVTAADSVSARADGTVKLTTYSRQVNPETSADAATNSTSSSGGASSVSSHQYGGFVAVSVGIQDVDASITGSANVRAENGDVLVSSSAVEEIDDQAISANGAESQTANQQTVSGITGLLSALFSSIVVPSASSKISSLRNVVTEKDGYSITSASANNGSIRTNGKAEAGSTVNVVFVPDQDYYIEDAWYTWLPAGSKTFTRGELTYDDEADKFTFVMPTSDVTVYVKFTKDRKTAKYVKYGRYEDNDGLDMGLSELFDESTSGSETTSSSSETSQSAATYTITPYSETAAINGQQVTRGSVLTNNTSAAVGENLNIIVNPSTGYALKDGTLKAIVKNAAGKVINTTYLTKNSGGNYVFTMPAGNVSFEAEFVQSTSSTTGTKKQATRSSSQATGAFAVSYVKNENEAFIDTTGTVHAGRKVSVLAKASTTEKTVADGSGVVGAPGQTISNPGTAVKLTDPTTVDDVFTSEQNYSFDVTGKKTVNGQETKVTNTITFHIPETKNASIQLILPTGGSTKIQLKLSIEQGYKAVNATGAELDAITFLYDRASALGTLQTAKGSLVFKKDSATGYWTAELPTDYYVVVTEANVATNTAASRIATFNLNLFTIAADSHKITRSTTDGYISLSSESANTGDTVTVEAEERAGYNAAVYYVDASTTADTAVTELPAGAVEIKKNASGAYTFEMPGKDVHVRVLYKQKAFHIITSGNVTVDAEYADPGDTIHVTGSTKNQNASGVTVEFGKVSADGTTITANEAGRVTELNFSTATHTFTIPTEWNKADAAGKMIRLSSTTASTDKGFTIVVNNPETGGTVSVKGGVTKADRGDAIILSVITTDKNMTIQESSMKATISTPAQTTNTGTNTGTSTSTATTTTTAPATETVVAVRNSDGTWTLTIPKATGTGAITSGTITLTPVFTTKSSAAAEKSVSLGAAVTVSVVKHVNNAYIKSGTIEAESISVSALSGDSKSRMTMDAQSKAGYSKGNIGIGGAVTVHVVSVKNQAEIAQDAKLTIDGGDLSVRSLSYETIRTTADGTSEEEAGNVGVGAGIAVGVTGIDVTAKVADQTVISSTAENPTIGDVTIDAKHGASETVTAKAGSAGGYSVTPVLAVNVTGSHTEAVLGKAAEGFDLPVSTGTISINAFSLITHTASSNASAAGSSVGFGASPVVSVINDSSEAYAKRKMQAKNISLKATSVSTSTVSSIASARGASSQSAESSSSSGDEQGSADHQANSSIAGATNVAGTTGSTNINPITLNSLTSNRQNAQTAEGNVQIAAAFALAIMRNVSVAAITGDAGSVAADEDLSVVSVNKTDSKVQANGSAVSDDTSIGVAVAINIATYRNEAYIENADITAGDLTVKAVMPKDGSISSTSVEKAQQDKDLEEANAEAAADDSHGTLYNLVHKAIESGLLAAEEAMGLDRIFDEDELKKFNKEIADLVGEITQTAIDTLTTNTGLTELIGGDILTQLKTRFTNFTDTFTKWYEGLGDSVQTELTSVLQKCIINEALNYLKSMVTLNDLSDKTTSLSPSGNGSAATREAHKEALKSSLKNELTKIQTSISDEMKNYLYSMSAGVLEEAMNSLVNVGTLRSFFSGNIAEKLKNNAINAAIKSGKVITDYALKKLSGWANLGVKTTTAGYGHTFDTQAVSGAGGGNIGVAGGVTVAVINGTTRAYILTEGKNVTVNGALIIKADSGHLESTAASAALDGDGEIDENLSVSESDTGITNTGRQYTNASHTAGIQIENSWNGQVSVETEDLNATTRKVTVTLSPDAHYAAGSVAAVFEKYKDAESQQGADGKPDPTRILTPVRSTTNPNQWTFTYSIVDFALNNVIVITGIFIESPATVTTGTVTGGTITVYNPSTPVDTTTSTGNGTTSTGGSASTGTTGTTTNKNPYKATAKASPGNKVMVKITPDATHQIRSTSTLADPAVYYTYTSTSGETNKKVAILTLEDANQNIYAFYMPTDVDAQYAFTVNAVLAAKTAGTGTTANDTATTPEGSSIGVGASFSLLVDHQTVEAYVDGNGTVTADSVSITATGTKEQKTTSVSGTDPINIDTEEGKADVDLDNDEESGSTGTGTGSGTDAGTGSSTGTETGAAEGGAAEGGAAEGEEEEDDSTDHSVDASVSINISNTNIHAYTGENVVFIVTGSPDASDEDLSKEDPEVLSGDFLLYAKETGRTLTQASGFAAGSKTAVGAAVSINIANADTVSEFAGLLNAANGNVFIRSYAYNEDDSKAIATAVGADIERYLNKFNETLNTTSAKVDKVLNGGYEGSKTTNTNNQTAGTVNSQLQQNANSNNQNNAGGTSNPSRDQANNNQPVSRNVLNSQDVTAPSTSGSDSRVGQAQQQGRDTASENTPAQTSTTPSRVRRAAPAAGATEAADAAGQTESRGIQVAAAVGLNITNEKAKTLVKGTIVSSRNAMFTAVNHGNFQTLGTGATMTLAESQFAIAVGVAVSVDRNEAVVEVGSNTNSEIHSSESVSVTADLTQNMDGNYRGLLGAQAIAGSVTGTADAAIAGAFAVLVSKAVTTAEILPYTIISTKEMTLSAQDKTKLAIRAGSISASKGGASVGLGASFAIIYASNKVTAEIGHDADITAETLNVRAVKLRVDKEDYDSVLGLSDLISDSTGAEDSEGTTTEKGVINLNKVEGSDSYTIDITISTDTILNGLTALNFLSSNNYYVEAISGAVSAGGSGKLAAAGSFSMVFWNNQTRALIDDSVRINLTRDLELTAVEDTSARLIAGALSAGTSKVGVGLSLTFLYDENTVESSVGEGAVITVGGSYTQNADTTQDLLSITVAAGATSGTVAVGGNIGLTVLDNTTKAFIGDNTTVHAGNNVTVHAGLNSDMILEIGRAHV